MKEKMYVVKSGEYAGRVGRGEINLEYGNIMFYPIEGVHPYRVCLKLGMVEELNKEDSNDRRTNHRI